MNFRNPSDWKRWITRWQQHRVILGVHLQDASTQVNTFLYTMGRKEEDFLTSLYLSEAELKDYGAMKRQIDARFNPHVSVIHETAKFSMIK